MRDLSPTIFRGQPDGDLRTNADFMRPLFFAEDFNLAQSYARGTQPVACVLQGTRALDLTEPDYSNPLHRELVARLTARFPQWTCRYSGEPRDVWSFLIAGDLYNYDVGDDRWRALFRVALDEMSFDAVRVIDVTDGLAHNNEPRRIWVSQQAHLVRRASPGEELVERLAQCPWPLVRLWLADHPQLHDLPARVERMLATQPGLAARAMAEFLPEHIGQRIRAGVPLTIFQANAAGGPIRPGDRVQLVGSDTGGGLPAALVQVHPGDLFLSEDRNDRFLYWPYAWRRLRQPGMDIQAYLSALNQEMLRMLADGETASLQRHGAALKRIHRHCVQEFPEHLADSYHGPSHWARVSAHAAAVARSIGVDPLLPTIFGMVHDSQREDDGLDPEHGSRAAEFIQEHRHGLFAFLSDPQVLDLRTACELHSTGETQGSPVQRACWDGDRLDLARVAIRPRPEYLCTPYARRQDVIDAACVMAAGHHMADAVGERNEEHDTLVSPARTYFYREHAAT